ncbi:hypothetical protein, partial [Methanoregula sp.]|uniref:hypothetical protein n=1 Tax=Methanoregula sp. TaxID=2052170 RepID=UPI003C76D248
LLSRPYSVGQKLSEESSNQNLIFRNISVSLLLMSISGRYDPGISTGTIHTGMITIPHAMLLPRLKSEMNH